MAQAPLLRPARFEIASFGELLSDPSRTAILLALLDGTARPATELADIAGVTRSTASAHLRRLVEGRALSVEPQGRHRYFRLASDEIAGALESLAVLGPPRPRSVRRGATPDLLAARTCYHHLAGRLGVAWLGALERSRLLRPRDGALTLSPRGMRALDVAGLTPDAGAWPPGRTCLDWTERRHHLGGPLGALLTHQLFARGWLARRSESRAVRVTARGAEGLARHFGVALPDPTSPVEP